LQESVACICAVVQYLTHDFGRLVALLKSCNGNCRLSLHSVFFSTILARLQQEIVRPGTQPLSPPEIKALSILIFIASLLGEYCDFDRVRHEKPGKWSRIDLIHTLTVLTVFKPRQPTLTRSLR
jgi:cohesin loading factor subunit SCC2